MRPITLSILCQFSLLVVSSFGQGSSCPPNIDFELGDFSNWECSIGNTSSTGIQNVITLTPSIPTTNRHEIISASTRPALDRFGGFPKLCPYGGNYSVRLGNESIGAQAEGLSYTFTVPTTVDTFTFTYFYAVVLQDPQHSAIEQPRFFVTAYEVLTGAVINCASYTYVSSSGLPGFRRSTVDTSVLYRDWSPTSLQFAGLGGRQVRLEFKTADCTLSGHFGYAYFDVGSGCSNILASAPYCIETNSLLLNAPYGFASYVWYNTNYTQVLGNQQNITFSPPPTTTGVFHVDCIPYPGFGCRDTFNAVVTPLPVPDTPAAQTLYKVCQNAIMAPLTATASPGNLLLWYTTPTGGIGSDVAPIPSTATQGFYYYYVSQKVLFGCEGFRRKITVQVLPSPIVNFNINANRQCQNNNRFIFTTANSNLLSPTYTWDFGDNTIINTNVDTPIQHSYLNAGNYTVTLSVTNDSACTKTKQLQVTVVPKPIADFTYPPIICQNQTQLAVIDRSVVPNGASSINSWWWNFAGNILQTQNPNSYIPTQAGSITVKLVVKTTEGCLSDTTSQSITIHSQPKAGFTISQPLCENETIQFRDASTLPINATGETINQWNWLFDNSLPYNIANPYFNLVNGNHQIAYTVETNFGCKSRRLDSTIAVQPKPMISLSINDSCVFRNIRYQANDARNIATNWLWNFGTGYTNSTALITKYYSKKGSIPLILIGQTLAGCKDTLNRPFAIFDNIAFAGRDTLTAMWQPVHLNANGYPNTTYLWSPNIGLDSTNIEKPTATWDKDQLYTLYALTKEGCDKTTKILVKRFKGPEIYIPTAFTPNGDHRNDSLKVFPVGIKSFGHFTVFNRFGNVVFTTNDFTKGWDGKQNGQPADSGTYIAIAEAVDYLGKPMIKREIVLLIQ